MKPDRLEWRPEYSIGNDEIDEQHMRIFRLCQELYDIADATGPDAHERFHQLIDEVVRYMKTHFHCEQFFMEVNGYPEYIEHCQEHQKVLADLAEQLASIVNNQSGCTEFADLIARWIRDHILSSDMKLKSITGAQ